MPREERRVLETTRRAKTVINVAALTMIACFGWLQYRNAPIGEALAGASPEILLRVSLCLYFLCWVAGTKNDTDEQEFAYAAGLDEGFPRGGYLSAVSIFLVFGALCLVRSAVVFSFLLLAFLIVNIVTWRFLAAKVIPPAVRDSKEKFIQQGDLCARFVLRNFDEYMRGNWQWWRFSYGMVVVGLMIYVAVAGLPGKAPAYLNQDNALGVLLFGYVVTFEGWIWYMRLRVKFRREVVLQLEKECALTPGEGGAQA